MKKTEWLDLVAVICGTIIVVLTLGEPDLLDAIIKKVGE